MIIPNDPNNTSKVKIGQASYILDPEEILDEIGELLLSTDFTFIKDAIPYIKIRHFLGMGDTEEHYANRKRNMPEDWEYHFKNVNYMIGKHGYRCAEFEDIDWNNSIVFFGCSNVFGVGVDQRDTVTSRVKDLTGYDTVNLGVGGSSIDFNVKNQVKLAEHGIKPKAVVNLWTSYERLLEANIGQINDVKWLKMCHHGAWAISPAGPSQYDDFVSVNLLRTNPNHSVFMARENRRIAKVLWRDIPHIELTYFEQTQKIFDIDFIKTIDRARDEMHPGSKTNDMLAKHIASLLQAQGL